MRELARRAIAAHWSALTLIGLIIAVCGTTVFAIPGYLDRHRDTALHAALTGGRPGAADLTVSAGVGTGRPDALEAATQAIPAALSPTLLSVLTETSTTVGTVFGASGDPHTQQKLAAPQGEPPAFALRSPFGSDGKLRQVAGEAPPSATSMEGIGTTVVTPPGQGPNVDGIGGKVAYEPPLLVWVSQENAAQLHIAVGDTFTISDRTFRAANPTRLQVAGIFAPTDPGDPYWTDPDGGPTTLAAPRIASKPNPADHDSVNFLTADLLFQNSDAERIVHELGVTATWTFTPATAKITPGNAPAVIADLDRLASGVSATVNPTVSGGPDSGGVAVPVLVTAPAFASRLPAILGDYLHDAGTAMILMSLGLACLLAVGVGVLVLAIRLLLHRQHDELVVCRARGASVPMLGRAVALQIAAAAVPAAALAAGLVVGAGYAGPGIGITAAALVTAVGACLLAALMTVGELRGTGGRGAVAQRLGNKADAVARVTVEVSVFLVLAAEISMLRSRGITGTAAAGIDPLTAALPVAIALAAGVVLLRLRPLLPAVLGWLLGNGRGATGFVGTANARRDSAIGGVASVVILMTLSSAVFGATFSASLSDARDRSEWQAVGAPARINDPLAGLNASEITPGDITLAKGAPGITAVSAAAIDSSATIESTGDSAQSPLTMIAMDVPGYLRVIQGTEVDTPGLRAGLTSLVTAMGAHPDSAYTPYTASPLPLPALVSPDLAGQAAGPGLTALFGGKAVPLQVVGVLDGLPTGFGSGSMVVVGYDEEKVATATAATNSDLFAAGTPDGLAALERIGVKPGFSDPTTTVTLESRVHGGANAQPLGTLVQRLQVAETALEAALCALAVLLTLAIGASARGRAAAFLATMGFGRGQLRRVAVIETLPLLVLVTVGGVGTGILVLPVLAGSIDLPTLTGLTTQLRVHADLVAVGVAAVAVPGVALAAVLGEGLLRKRLGLVGVLRAGDR